MYRLLIILILLINSLLSNAQSPISNSKVYFGKQGDRVIKGLEQFEKVFQLISKIDTTKIDTNSFSLDSIPEIKKILDEMKQDSLNEEILKDSLTKLLLDTTNSYSCPIQIENFNEYVVYNSYLKPRITIRNLTNKRIKSFGIRIYAKRYASDIPVFIASSFFEPFGEFDFVNSINKKETKNLTFSFYGHNIKTIEKVWFYTVKFEDGTKWELNTFFRQQKKYKKAKPKHSK